MYKKGRSDACLTLKKFTAVLRNTAVAAAIALCLLFILCFASYGSRDPDKNLTMFAYVSQILMFFICALVSSLTCRENPVSGAVMSCSLLMLVMFAVSLVVRRGSAPDLISLAVIAGDIAVAALGIIIGLKKSKPDAKKLRKNIISKYRPK